MLFRSSLSLQWNTTLQQRRMKDWYTHMVDPQSKCSKSQKQKTNKKNSQARESESLQTIGAIVKGILTLPADATAAATSTDWVPWSRPAAHRRCMHGKYLVQRPPTPILVPPSGSLVLPHGREPGLFCLGVCRSVTDRSSL